MARRFTVSVWLDVPGQPGRWGMCEVVIAQPATGLKDLPALYDAIERLIIRGMDETGRFKVMIEANEIAEPKRK